MFGGRICEMSYASLTKANNTSAVPVSWDEFRDKYTDYCVRVLTKLNEGFFGMESSSQKLKTANKQSETHEAVPETESSDNTPSDNTETGKD